MMFRLRRIAVAVGALALGGAGANAAPCTNPNAMGVSRVMTVNARALPLIGSHDYGVTLPLAPGEVVLTFDDGPLAPYTNAVLKALADECLQAIFFMVGRQASADPQLARQVRAAGHTIGTHTQNHLLYRMPPDRAAHEIDTGIASVGAAFGSQRALAPFFRFPGLFRTAEAEQHLRSRGLMAWSVDADSYDWKKISSGHMLNHTLAELEKRRGGILLMHDVQAKTALTLPTLLREMKARGYRIVHVVPVWRERRAGPCRQRTAASRSCKRRPSPRAATAAPVPSRPGRTPCPPPETHSRGPGGNGLFEAIFTASPHLWGR